PRLRARDRVGHRDPAHGSHAAGPAVRPWPQPGGAVLVGRDGPADPPGVRESAGAVSAEPGAERAERTKVTLVSTVRDAAREIGEFLDSVAAQTRPPDEVVIADGGSTDGTAEILRAAGGIVLIEEPGANISQGRNLAVGAATHDVIAVSDADCI